MKPRKTLGGSLAVGLIAAAALAPTPAQADLPDWVVISNGTVMLGVNDVGSLNVPAGLPSGTSGTPDVGLRYVPNNHEATAAGCLCEGWGFADATTSVSGWANESSGDSTNLVVDSFTATATTAVSTVTIDGKLRVTHNYHPSATPNLYAVDVTLTNLTGAPIEPRYRRVMDWDIEPTEFWEFTTIQGTAAADDVLFASDDGFASGDPLSGQSQIDFAGDAVDSGPNDHGALFDFGFPTIAAGASHEFTTFYGAAGSEAQANAALAAVGAEVYSYGQPSTETGATVGDPNTFIFAFEGVGGTPAFPTASWAAASSTVTESVGNAVVGSVVLSGPATTPVTVDWATSNGTALAGSDYTASSGTVTFAPGETSANVVVPIINDTLEEPDETFTVTLSNVTGGALPGSPSALTVTIQDDDESVPVQPSVALSSATYSVGEAAGAVTVNLALSGPSGLPVTVTYATSNGTATAGADYTASTGTVTFVPGATSGSFTVPIINDALDEPDETFTVTLSAPVNATLGSPATGTVTILDNDEPPPADHGTSTAYSGGLSVQYSDPVTLTGTLLDTTLDPDAPLAGQSLGFTLGTQSASATTNATGVASTSLVVTQQPGTVSSVATAFAGAPGYLPSSDSDAFTILRESCLVTVTAPTSSTGAVTLSATLGEDDATLGDRSGKTITFGLDNGSTVTPVTGTTNGSGTASASTTLPLGVYAVSAGFAGDDWYESCSGTTGDLTVVAPSSAKVTGGGWVGTGGKAKAHFGLVASPTEGQLQAKSGGDKFHGSTVSSLTVTGNTAVWTGGGRFNGVEGYVFSATVVDNGKGKGKKSLGPDTFNLVVRDANGVVVMSISGPLGGGNLTVR